MQRSKFVEEMRSMRAALARKLGIVRTKLVPISGWKMPSVSALQKRTHAEVPSAFLFEAYGVQNPFTRLAYIPEISARLERNDKGQGEENSFVVDRKAVDACIDGL
jgi:hypothetical protein